MWPERADWRFKSSPAHARAPAGRPFSCTRIVKEMRRFLTLALVVGLAMLVAAGLVDALRSQPERRPSVRTSPPGSQAPKSVQLDVDPANTPPPWVEDRAALGDRLRRNGVAGTLYLSAAGCSDGRARPVRALRLPELELRRGAPRTKGCLITAPDDGQPGRGGTWTVDPAGEYATRIRAGYLESTIGPAAASGPRRPNCRLRLVAGRQLVRLRRGRWQRLLRPHIGLDHRFSLRASTRTLAWR